MKRISVTTLEKFRRFITEASAYDTEASLIESLKGLFKGNDKTKFGGAYHKLIEGEYHKHNDEIKVKCFEKNILDEFVFTSPQAVPALAYRLNHPALTHEMNVSKIYDTIHGSIQVTGRVDGIEGMLTRDVKTRFKSLDVQEYIDSSQWKFYLDMLDSNIFFYDVFEVQGFKELPAKQPYRMNDVRIIAHDPIRCNRYETMMSEINTLLNDFIEYINNRKFFDLLKPALQETESLNF
jgi:hypothetical protein